LVRVPSSQPDVPNGAAETLPELEALVRRRLSAIRVAAVKEALRELVELE
jgi:hypothetical protein